MNLNASNNPVKWPLMKNTITFIDRIKLLWFVATSNKFTHGPMVRKFEEKWNEWLGSKYSLYVSSGSTANLLLLSAVKELYGLKNGDKVLVPACTWVTNVAPVIQTGLQPIFSDINLENYSFDISKIEEIKKKHPDIKVIFVTHLLGLSSDLEILKKHFPQAHIIEDVCESHGVKNKNGEKQGKNSLGATYSFYFGHHMTTVEGGMVSTNNKELYELMRLKRSHGLAREGSPDFFEKYKNQHPDILPSFLFMTDGYNFRNTELGAVLGLSQLKRLDDMIAKRRRNYDNFMKIIKKHPDKFYIPAYDEGNSSFSFPFICKSEKTYQFLIDQFEKNGVEYRPVVSGNLLVHPFLSKYKISTKKPHNVDILHTTGIYIGNSHFVNDKDLQFLDSILDSI